MKTKLVFGTCLALVLIFSLTQQSYAVTSLFPNSPPKKTINTYVDEGLGYQINIPSGWHDGSLNDDELTREYSLIMLSPDENARIGVMYQQLSMPIIKTTPDKFSQAQKTMSENLIKKIMQTALSNTKIGKISGTYYWNGILYSIPYTQSVNSNDQNFQVRGIAYIYLLTSGDMYFVETLSDARYYKTYQPDFIKSVKSFYVFPDSNN